MNHQAIVDALIAVGREVRRRVSESLRRQAIETRTAIHTVTAEDDIFQIDHDIHETLMDVLGRRAVDVGGVALIAEGVGEEDVVVLPGGMTEEKAAWRVIMDPIDGTRVIMYDKRSAFFLAGAAPNRGAGTRLRDIEAAVMVELPTTRAMEGDVLWAIRGQGAKAVTDNLLDASVAPRAFSPSRAKSIYGGFAQIVRLFHPGKVILTQIEEDLAAELFPDAPANRAYLFEDQYISTGGQLYEMLMGRDRFIAELRAGLYERMQRIGGPGGLCCHPYDLAAHLIGEEAGVIITGRDGKPLDAPMDVTTPVDWIGYANADIQREVEPVLRRLLVKYDME